MQVKRANNILYILNLDFLLLVCLLTHLDDVAWRWHARYGHLNFKAQRKLGLEGLVKGLPPVNHVEQVCDGCLASK